MATPLAISGPASELNYQFQENLARITDRLFYVARFGALGDGSFDNATAFQDALTAAGVSGGVVVIPAGDYYCSSNLTAGAKVRVIGQGHQTRINFDGTDYLFTFGDPSASSLIQGCGIADLRIVLSTASGKGIRFASTNKACAERLWIEGNTTSISGLVGVYVDGGNTASNLFTRLSHVQCHHIYQSFVLGTVSSTKSLAATSATLESCYAFGDLLTASAGIVIEGSQLGHLIIGGNLENCVRGITAQGGEQCSVVGTRFEGNTTDIELVTVSARTSHGWSFTGLQNLDTLSNSAGHRYSMSGCYKSDTTRWPDRGGQFEHFDDVKVIDPATGATKIIAKNTGKLGVGTDTPGKGIHVVSDQIRVGASSSNYTQYDNTRIDAYNNGTASRLYLNFNGGGVNIQSLPSYANNAAAVTGGLGTGDLYRTGGDPDTVCVVH